MAKQEYNPNHFNNIESMIKKGKCCIYRVKEKRKTTTSLFQCNNKNGTRYGFRCSARVHRNGTKTKCGKKLNGGNLYENRSVK
jgi:hypothetical protein